MKIVNQLKLFISLSVTTLLTISCELSANLDLEAKLSDFVIETKRIVIPGYPDAFNPSIIRWDNSILMAFRYRDQKTGSTDHMAIVELDEDFNVLGHPLEIVRLFEPFHGTSRAQDPRLISFGGNLHIVYNNFVDLPKEENRRMYIATIHHVGFAYVALAYNVIKNFPGSSDHVKEKNWVPFVYNDKLFLSYSLNPHQVLYPHLDKSGDASAVYNTSSKIDWKWGPLLGGSQAFNIGGKYLSFFHSVVSKTTVQSNGELMPHYFMGAYLFNEEPPFDLTHVSPSPIIGKNFYNGPAYKTWKPLRVVFPGGFISDEKTISLVYGRQDFESWVVKIDKQKLLDSLVELKSAK